MSEPQVWAVWQRQKRIAAHLWTVSPLNSMLAVSLCDLPSAGAIVYRTDLSPAPPTIPKCLRCLRAQTLEKPV